MEKLVNAQVREAINRIERIPFSRGPNFYTVDVEGWSINAPTRPQLAKMLWDWFNDRRPLMAWVFDDLFPHTGATNDG